VASWDRKVPINYTLQNTDRTTLLEEKVLFRTLKGSISATYLEPLKGYIHSLKNGFSGFYIEPWGSVLGQ